MRKRLTAFSTSSKPDSASRAKRCGAACTQVIVLSHDQDFLRIWDRLPPAERKCLKRARVGLRDTTVVELDIEEATQAAFKAAQGAAGLLPRQQGRSARCCPEGPARPRKLLQDSGRRPLR